MAAVRSERKLWFGCLLSRSLTVLSRRSISVEGDSAEWLCLGLCMPLLLSLHSGALTGAPAASSSRMQHSGSAPTSPSSACAPHVG